VRVISLTDGRICYLNPARAKKPLPPGQAVAFASVSTQPRFPVHVPLGWESMHETDLRRHVEQHVAAAEGAPPRPSSAPAAPRRRGVFR
jgi:hypothetical protein